MKCYYEELDLERNASESEIKSAYRKLALKWHPDKNPDCIDVAKERFQLIQQAYDVLSDPQERAWYDNHREQILRGKNSDFEDNCLDVFKYFTVSCFKGYGDDEKGFYAVYQEVFNKISAEDAEFMDSEEDFLTIPKFGDSKSSYEEVVAPFYAYWSAYCTKRTYTWLCPYDIREVKDRRIIREIEKKMKKVIQKAKKERNEEVRNLVAFVRKRDKRVQAFREALEERTALNREKQERNRMEQKRRRQQELEEMRNNSQVAHISNDDYEEQLKQLELEYSSDDNFSDDNKIEEVENDEDSNPNDGLYCVACNKDFKTEKSFANHETSRKHRDNVEKIKIEMRNEESHYVQEETLNESKDVETNDLHKESSPKEYEAKDDNNLTKIQNKAKSKKEAKNVKQSNVLNFADKTEDDAEALDILNKNDEDDGEWETRNKKSLKKNKNKTRNTRPKTNLTELPGQEQQEPALKNENVVILKSDTPQLTCATCKANFESKNKLFSHLKILNHAVFVPNAKIINVENTKSGKNKRRN